MGIEVRDVLHMKEGTGETSYVRSSYIQKQVLELIKPIREEAIRQFYIKEQPPTLCIVDLGSSSIELSNKSVVYELVATVEEVRRKLGYDTQDYQIYLNDLPGNDFNTVFRSLPSFQEDIKQQIGVDGHCFVSGVPGSFYDRLFPTNSLHFVHSSYSLHWLSEVPKGIDDNKKNICIARTSSHNVTKAYQEQFQKDFSAFLGCRSMEIVPGGCMVLTCMGRDSNEPYTKKAYHMYELLGSALNDIVSEGKVAEEKLDSFNIPHYCPSEAELRLLIEREGSFTLNGVHISEVQWEYHSFNELDSFHSEFDHYDFTKCMRSVTESLLVTHFGEGIIDEVFQRFREIVRQAQANENNVFTNVTVLMTRIG